MSERTFFEKCPTWVLGLLFLLSSSLTWVSLEKAMELKTDVEIGDAKIQQDNSLFFGQVTTVKRRATRSSFHLLMTLFGLATTTGSLYLMMSRLLFELAKKSEVPEETEPKPLDPVDIFLCEQVKAGTMWICEDYASKWTNGDVREAAREMIAENRIRQPEIAGGSIPLSAVGIVMPDFNALKQPAPIPSAVPTNTTAVAARPRTQQLPNVTIIPQQKAIPEVAPIVNKEPEVLAGELAAREITAKLKNKRGEKVSFHSFIKSPSMRRYYFDKTSGLKVSQIVALEQDFDMAFQHDVIPSYLHPSTSVSVSSDSRVYVDVPRQDRQIIYLENYLWLEPPTGKPLIPLGVDINDELTWFDLSNNVSETILIGSVPGGGKSVVMRNMLFGLAYQCLPHECQIILLDTKKASFNHVEPADFPWLNLEFLYPETDDLDGEWTSVPHPLGGRCVVNSDDIPAVINYLREIVTRRIELFGKVKCQDRDEFIRKFPKYTRLVPFIVVLWEELYHANTECLRKWVQAGNNEIPVYKPSEELGAIASIWRAAGIGGGISLQNPISDEVGSNMKAMVTARLALRVTDISTSKVILGGTDTSAVKLMGKGDMVFKSGSLNGRFQAPHHEDNTILPLLLNQYHELMRAEENQSVIPSFTELASPWQEEENQNDELEEVIQRDEFEDPIFELQSPPSEFIFRPLAIVPNNDSDSDSE